MSGPMAWWRRRTHFWTQSSATHAQQGTNLVLLTLLVLPQERQRRRNANAIQRSPVEQCGPLPMKLGDNWAPQLKNFQSLARLQPPAVHADEGACQEDAYVGGVHTWMLPCTVALLLRFPQRSLAFQGVLAGEPLQLTRPSSRPPADFRLSGLCLGIALFCAVYRSCVELTEPAPPGS